MPFYEPKDNDSKEQYGITSGFEDRKAPVPGASTSHKGQDFAAKLGAKIPAAEDGKVITSTEQMRDRKSYGYGKYVVLEHRNSKGQITGYTLYGHMSETEVKVGDRVKKGDTLGWVGNTGTSSGPHLHFEVRPTDPNNPTPWYRTEPVDPSKFEGFKKSSFYGQKQYALHQPVVTVGAVYTRSNLQQGAVANARITRLDLLDPVSQQEMIRRYPAMIRPMTSRNNIGSFLSGGTLRRDSSDYKIVHRIEADGSRRGFFIS